MNSNCSLKRFDAKDYFGGELQVGPTPDHFKITGKMDELAADLKQREER